MTEWPLPLPLPMGVVIVGCLFLISTWADAMLGAAPSWGP